MEKNEENLSEGLQLTLTVGSSSLATQEDMEWISTQLVTSLITIYRSLLEYSSKEKPDMFELRLLSEESSSTISYWVGPLRSTS